MQEQEQEQEVTPSPGCCGGHRGSRRSPRAGCGVPEGRAASPPAQASCCGMGARAEVTHSAVKHSKFKTGTCKSCRRILLEIAQRGSRDETLT